MYIYSKYIRNTYTYYVSAEDTHRNMAQQPPPPDRGPSGTINTSRASIHSSYRTVDSWIRGRSGLIVHSK